MFYVSRKLNGKYGVIDTEDGVEEYFTPQELMNMCKNYGIKIKGVTSDGIKVYKKGDKKKPKCCFIYLCEDGNDLESIGAYKLFTFFDGSVSDLEKESGGRLKNLVEHSNSSNNIIKGLQNKGDVSFKFFTAHLYVDFNIVEVTGKLDGLLFYEYMDGQCGEKGTRCNLGFDKAYNYVRVFSPASSSDFAKRLVKDIDETVDSYYESLFNKVKKADLVNEATAMIGVDADEIDRYYVTAPSILYRARNDFADSNVLALSFYRGFIVRSHAYFPVKFESVTEISNSLNKLGARINADGYGYMSSYI